MIERRKLIVLILDELKCEFINGDRKPFSLYRPHGDFEKARNSLNGEFDRNGGGSAKITWAVYIEQSNNASRVRHPIKWDEFNKEGRHNKIIGELSVGYREKKDGEEIDERGYDKIILHEVWPR